MAGGMEQNRQLWEAWIDGFQAAWNAETDEGTLPPAPIHSGPAPPRKNASTRT